MNRHLGMATGLVIVCALAAWSFLPTKPEVSEKYKQLVLAAKLKEKKEKNEFPGEAAAFIASRRETANGESPEALSERALEQARQESSQRGANPPVFGFRNVGPGNIGGRSRALIIDPTNEQRMLLGAVSGGVWRTEDGGLQWNPVNDFLPNLAINSMILDPDDATRVFAGTGEGFFNIDAAAGFGIYVSEDFGLTWNRLVSTETTDFLFVNRLAMIPGTDVLIAATRTGLFRSDDHGSSWTEVSAVGTNGRGFVDLKLDPSDANRLYASHFGGSAATSFMMRSDNAGLTWTRLGAAEGMPTTDLARIEIGIGSDGVVYASIGRSNHTTRGLWRSPAGEPTLQKRLQIPITSLVRDGMT